jgi:hypothetical protein
MRSWAISRSAQYPAVPRVIARIQIRQRGISVCAE